MKKDGSLVVGTSNNPAVLRLRKEAGYLLLKTVYLSDMLAASKSSLEVSAPEFDALYCYYFKKVRKIH